VCCGLLRAVACCASGMCQNDNNQKKRKEKRKEKRKKKNTKILKN
jgi:hypothetical protein